MQQPSGPVQLSPDGAYWWDGTAWQPVQQAPPPPPAALAYAGPPPSLAPPVPDPNRPGWLAPGMELPNLGPQAFAAVEPVVAYAGYTPSWNEPAAPQAPSRPTGLSAVGAWAGVVVGGAVLLFGTLGLIAIERQPTAETVGAVPVAITFAVIGAVVMAVFLLRAFGYSLNMGPASEGLSQLGIVGGIVLGLMILNTWIALSEPVGTGRYALPLTGIVVGIRRALMGRWLAVFILGGTWLVCVGLIQARGGP